MGGGWTASTEAESRERVHDGKSEAMILTVWLLLAITGPISAHISTYAYTSEQACEAHAQGAQRCVEFRSAPIEQYAPAPPEPGGEAAGAQVAGPAQSGISQPGISQPGFVQPGMAEPGAAQPGAPQSVPASP